MTPAELGYYFPAEFAPQKAMWLSWPHKEESWPGKIQTIYAPYAQFVKEVALGQEVHINVVDAAMQFSGASGQAVVSQWMTFQSVCLLLAIGVAAFVSRRRIFGDTSALSPLSKEPT